MTRTQVISDLITKYDGVINGTDTSAVELAVFKVAICQLVDAAFSGGGGGGTSAATISSGIDGSTDIDTIIAKLTSIVTNTGSSGTSAATISSGIDGSTDIDTIITKLTSLDTGKLTQSGVEAAIQAAADIDTIITKLTTIATNTAGGGGGGGGASVIATYTHSAPSVSDTGTVALAANTSRKGAVIVNRSTTNPVDLFFGTVGTYGTGLPLSPGQSYEINSTNLYAGVIRAITSSGVTGTLSVAEGI